MKNVVGTLWCISVICVMVASVISTGCGPTKSNGRVDNVVKVIVHSGTEYTIMYKKDDEIKSLPINLSGSGKDNKIRIITDVPKGEPMWASWRNRTVYRNSKNYVGYAEIHVHDEKDIEGGGKQN